MKVQFIIKELLEDDDYRYLRIRNTNDISFTTRLKEARMFDNYGEAETLIGLKLSNGIFQIDKIFVDD